MGGIGGSGSGSGGGGTDMSQLMTMMMSMEASLLMARSSPGQMNDMSALCNNFGGINGMGGAYNNNIYNACDNAKASCSKSCEDTRHAWQGRSDRMAERCGNRKDIKKRVDAALSEILKWTSKCENLEANNNAKVQAGNFNAAQQGAMQNACAQLANRQQQQPPQPPQPIQMPQQVDCTNPVQAQMYSSQCTACAQANGGQPCQAAVVDGNNPAASFQPASSSGSTASQMNVGAAGDMRRQQRPQLGDPNANGQNHNGGQNAGMPGAGGGLGGGGMMGSQGNPPPSDLGMMRRGGYGPSYHTDILNGERGGGGYSNPVGGTLDVDSSNAFKGYGTPGGPSSAGLDLKRYLPGNDRYAGRRQVAGVGTANPDINTFTTDIFKRISDRFKVICSMNRLVDCNLPKRPD